MHSLPQPLVVKTVPAAVIQHILLLVARGSRVITLPEMLSDASLVASVSADLVCVGGDMVDHAGSLAEKDDFDDSATQGPETPRAQPMRNSTSEPDQFLSCNFNCGPPMPRRLTANNASTRCPTWFASHVLVHASTCQVMECHPRDKSHA